ncbi:MAG: 50S ribosomal protein L6 [Phycisphaeraceae bacterium]|nr:50S ribosomal protein L6 [Phycisphaeraceae bacterium]
MSRIGKKPISLPGNVKVSVHGRDVTVEAGPSRLTFTHRPEVSVRVDDAKRQVIVDRQDDQRATRAYHGLTRAMINNMVLGVTGGFKKELEVNGVGWTAQVKGREVHLSVGYADVKKVPIPQTVTVQVQTNRITVTGPDRQAVGQCAANIRAVRKPEPYNGKGIKYVDEQITRKQGKAFAGGAA